MAGNRDKNSDEYRAGRWFTGHTWSVVASSWPFALSKTAGIVRVGRAQWAVATEQMNPFEMVMVACSVFAVAIFAAFFLALLPNRLMWSLARQYSISNVLYYLFCGGLIGGILSAVA